MNGLNIYNVLRAMPFRLVTHNVGNVDSIGNAVFLAGEERWACPQSTFMFHGVAFTPPANLPCDEKFLRERLASLKADHGRIAAIIEERSTLSAAEIEPLFLEAQTKDATYAVRAGIVHEWRRGSRAGKFLRPGHANPVPPGAARVRTRCSEQRGRRCLRCAD